METPRWGITKWLATAAILAVLAGPAYAQLVQLSGTVRGVTGLYVGDIAVGAPIRVQLDLRGPMVDLFPESPLMGLYRDRPLTFTCDGKSFPVDIWPNEVAIRNKMGGWLSGLDVSAAWSIEIPSAVVFGLAGDIDLMTCDSYFPAGIPMERFFYREGEYFDSDGRVMWSIDAYDVVASSPAGVPEPSTYGMLGAVCLSILAYRRRLVRGRRG